MDGREDVSTEEKTRPRKHGFFEKWGKKEVENLPETPPQKPVKTAFTPPPDDYMSRLLLALSGQETLPDPPEFHLDGVGSGYEESLAYMQEKAREWMLRWMTVETLKSGDVIPDDLSETAAEAMAPLNAACEVYVTEDGMTAWLCLVPPMNGGAGITEEDIRAVLDDRDVLEGLDEAVIDRLAREQPWLKLAIAARGLLPQNGRDGEIVDHYPREKQVIFIEDEDGIVDFKESNWLVNTHQGDTICDIVPPTEAVPGKTVAGRTVDAVPGKAATVPQGKNTQLSEDKLRLISAIDGQVSFSKDKFQVDALITIPGDVDASVGNLNILGDLVVAGDVLGGFTVKATGSISVNGIVEGAEIIAGGDVHLKRGMNGNNQGSVQSKGEIFAKFLENCTVHANGTVHGESMINCIVTSGDMVELNRGRGVIIGGTVTAYHAVEAKVIGNEAHRVTSVVVGVTPDLLQKKEQLTEAVSKAKSELEEMDKNITFLAEAVKKSPDYLPKFNQYKLQRSVQGLQFGKKRKELEELKATLGSMEDSYIKCATIYPGTRITLGLDCKVVSAVEKMCHVHITPDGISMHAG